MAGYGELSTAVDRNHLATFLFMNCHNYGRKFLFFKFNMQSL